MKKTLIFTLNLAIAVALGIAGAVMVSGIGSPDGSPTVFTNTVAITVLIAGLMGVALTLPIMQKIFPDKAGPTKFSRVVILFTMLAGVGLYVAGTQLDIAQLKGAGGMSVMGPLVLNALGGKESSRPVTHDHEK